MVSAAADAWLTAIKATDLTPNTIDAYDVSYRVHLESRFGAAASMRSQSRTSRCSSPTPRPSTTGSSCTRRGARRRLSARPTVRAPSIVLTPTTPTQIYKHARRFAGYAVKLPTEAPLSRAVRKLVSVRTSCSLRTRQAC